MGKSVIQRMRRAILPAAVVLPLLAALWIWGRWGYAGAVAWAKLSEGVLLGWLAMMFLAVTVAGVWWAASGPRSAAAPTGGGAPNDMRGQVFLGFAMLVDGCGLLLAGVAFFGGGEGLLTVGDVIRVYLLLAAWGGMWMEVTWLLRRVAGPRPGSGAMAAAISLALAMLLFAAPVTAVPVARSAAAWGAGRQGQVVRAIGVATPMLGVLDALKDSSHATRVDWPTLPEMYQLSNLGQDLPAPAPRWWVNGLVYAGVAGACWGLSRVRRRRRG